MSGHNPIDYFNLLHRSKRGGSQYYWTNAKNEFEIPRDSNNILIYAKDPQNNERYPEASDDQKYIFGANGYKYARDAQGNEYYAQGPDFNDKIIINDGKAQYAKDNAGNEFYPENFDGYQQFHGHYARTANQTIIYPLDENERPMYEKDSKTGDEMYHIDSLIGTPVIGKDGQGNQVYAKKANGNEFFAGIDTFAINKDGYPIYPVTQAGEIIFPQTPEGNEYYLTNAQGDDIIHSGGIILPRYAKDVEGGEVYPRQVVDVSTGRTSERIISDEYAKNKNGQPFYPIDGFGNEFIIDSVGVVDESKVLPLSYPITNDQFIIVPEIGSQPYFIQGESSPDQNDLEGQLFRF